ncbi:hypothetical protein DKX38_008489 [Salix brachista]|uniref:Nucleolar protein 10 n=1 Tax=Salix brachista TaxID=2182728 RepID=A0A5N5MQY2_9ROSI|nr:hypothetical protein DKX38_008489 [Salix brachista]
MVTKSTPPRFTFVVLESNETWCSLFEDSAKHAACDIVRLLKFQSLFPPVVSCIFVELPFSFVQKESPLGLPTESAHPARFSPDDKYSRQRFLLKKRFGLLPTQQSPLKY